MKRIIASSLLVTTLIQSVGFQAQARNDGRDVGTIIGGVIGGLIGSQVGEGDAAATIIGVIAGGLIGREVGRSLDDSDRRAYADAQRRCLSGSPGQRVTWYGSSYGSRTGAYGEFAVLREGRHYSYSSVCREYESVVIAGGRRDSQRGYTCQNSDGSWVEVRQSEVVFTPVYSQPHYYPSQPVYYPPQPLPPPQYYPTQPRYDYYERYQRYDRYDYRDRYDRYDRRDHGHGHGRRRP